MIVIATNNGMEFLPRLLDSIKEHGWYGQDVCVVDTGSTDVEFLKYLNQLDDIDNRLYPFSLYVERVSSGYDTGAYKRAYEYNRSVEDLFIFLQDSVEIKSSNWFPAIMNKLQEGDVCAWLTFGDWYDNQEQVDFVQKYFNEYRYEKGVFAPMFAIRTRDMDKVYEKTGIKDVQVYNKWTQQAMERGWAVAFEQAGLKLVSLDTMNWERLRGDSYEHFKKSFPVRQ
jgi:glycosyltransferase involved in cell wall biosynthesis